MTRAKAKQPTKGKQAAGKRATGTQAERVSPRGGLPRYAWLLIALAIAAVVVFVRLYPMGQAPPDNPGEPRAAIVDQLHNRQPNQAFIAEVTAELEDYGFEVDLYRGDEITVDFYRDLPTRGHKLIIFRAHSGILGGGDYYVPTTVLFTNEEYETGKHRRDQLADRLMMGAPGPNQPVMFGITPSFVTESMKGKFDDTVIIMMGCGGIALPDLAEAFVDKGASTYLAWHLSVLLPYTDEATTHLVRQLCSEQATIQEAVGSTMAVIGTDPQYEAELQYYPSETGDKTLEALLQIASPDLSG
jgi:hypothetical protein